MAECLLGIVFPVKGRPLSSIVSFENLTISVAYASLIMMGSGFGTDIGSPVT